MVTEERQLPAQVKNRAARNPLATSTFLLRNAHQTIPLTLVITLAVLLVAGIISMINSIPYSIRTIYGYSQEMLGLGPRGDMTLTPKIMETVRKESPVPVARLMYCRASSAQVKSIVGKWPFVVIGLQPADMQFYMDRMKVRSMVGRLPKPGEAAAVISRPVARNLDLKLGDALLKPDSNENYSPKEVKVVGIADTDMWFMFNDIAYQRANHFPPIDLGLAFARNLKDQDRLDRWAEKRFKGQRAQIFAYFQVEKQTNEMFVTLYKILNVVIGTLVAVITFMMAMLINIYQSQRLVEFGLLQAIGYTKRRLLKRVWWETFAVVLFGWLAGIVLSYGLLHVVKAVLMDPRAFALNPLDPIAYMYTLPLPITILAVAAGGVVRRFRTFDPIGVVERRVV